MQDEDKNLITHLEELRKTLIKCFLSVGISMPFMFFLSPKVLDILVKNLLGENKITLNFFSPMEVFLIQIKTAFLLSALVCFPYIIKKIWDFILPALYENERKFIKKAIFLSSALFISGVIFCLVVILPLIINFGMNFSTNSITPLFGFSNIINLAINMSLVFGLMFQVPIIVNMLIKSDIISYETISSKRPYVVVILLIFSAIFTPPDIISQILLFCPTYLLFEMGLFFSQKNQKLDKKE